jgi:hypothetical protein
MKVKAKFMGFYDNKRIKEGQVFELKDDSYFSERWMEKADSELEPSVSYARSKPAKVQQAPDARDIEAVQQKVLDENERISYSGGTKSMARPPMEAPKMEGDADHSGEEKEGGKLSRGIKKMLHKGDHGSEEKGSS